MTLQQLQYLLMARETNSISKAAENLFVAPSSVSACINSLEKELGFPIFIRNQKGLVSTPKGEAVLEYAQRMVRIYNQMATLREETQLHLRVVSINYYPVCAAFAQLVAEHRQCEDINFFMQTDSAESAVRRLAVGELDVVVAARHTSGWRKFESLLESNNLHWRALREIPYSICVGPGHRLYDRTSVQPQDLHREVFVDSAGRVYGSGFWGDMVEVNTEQRIAVGNDLARQELLRRGIGYSIQVYSQAEEGSDELRYIPLEGISATLCAITNPKTANNPLVERYITLVEQELGKVPDGN